jgi:uncharacterized protein YciI
MEFLILGYDGTDDGAMERRLTSRPAHLELANRLLAEGTLLYGAAILNDSGEMIGSALVCDFPSRAELDAWLAVEPYVTGKVWQRIDVHLCRPAPAFAKRTAT